MRREEGGFNRSSRRDRTRRNYFSLFTAHWFGCQGKSSWILPIRKLRKAKALDSGLRTRDFRGRLRRNDGLFPLWEWKKGWACRRVRSAKRLRTVNDSYELPFLREPNTGNSLRDDDLLARTSRVSFSYDLPVFHPRILPRQAQSCIKFFR